jgi:hypothetical protein
MKKYFVLVTLIFCVSVLPASAVQLSLNPQTMNVNVGDSFTIDLIASQLGSDIIADFDIDVLYDASQASFSDYTLGTSLGDVSLFEAADFSNGEVNAGAIDLAEVSLLTDPELTTLQSGLNEILLASLTFDCIAPGTSLIEIDGSDPLLTYKVGGAGGSQLTVALGNPVQLSQTPEPGTLLLLVLGIGMVGGARVYRNRLPRKR